MDAKRIAELRALAAAATPGPWRQSLYAWGAIYAGDSCKHLVTIGPQAIGTPADAEYIAAAHPRAVIALLDEVAQLREALGEAVQNCGGCRDVGGYNGYCTRCAPWRALLAADAGGTDHAPRPATGER